MLLFRSPASYIHGNEIGQLVLHTVAKGYVHRTKVGFVNIIQSHPIIWSHLICFGITSLGKQTGQSSKVNYYGLYCFAHKVLFSFIHIQDLRTVINLVSN